MRKACCCSGAEQNTIRFCPAADRESEEDVDLCLTLFEEALREVTNE